MKHPAKHKKGLMARVQEQTSAAKSNSLQQLTKIEQMLSEVRSAGDALRVKALAAAAETYARKMRLGLAAWGHAHAIRIDAECLLGGFLKDADKNKGAALAGTSRGTKTEPRGEIATLADLGLTKKESAEAQKLNAIAEQSPVEFQAIRAGEKSITQVIREQKRSAVSEAAKLPSSRFRVLYADPPWKYGDQLTEDYGPTKFHYPSMSISQLCDLKINELCEDNAVLFLWVTSPILEECFLVVKAWGFEYKTSFVWDKVKHNMGHYNSVRHELLLVCTRGSCLPDTKKLFDSVVTIERTAHSTKPKEFREMIDKLYPNGKRIELFAREEAEGWERWGNQA